MIDHDQIYTFYRTQSKETNVGKPPVVHQYGPVAARIYVTALLRAPATLEDLSGTKHTELTLPAGLTETSAPFQAGRKPSFRLKRGNRLVLSEEGPNQIQQSPEYNDFYYATGALTSP